MHPSSTHTCWSTRTSRGPVSKATRARGGKLDLDDLEGLPDAGRRDVATQIAGGRIAPLGLVGAPRDGTGGSASSSAGASNKLASGTPSPTDSFSSTTAVGLLSPRSMTEIMERLTPLRVARASRESPRALRSSRTRSAMRELRVVAAVSVMLD